MIIGRKTKNKTAPSTATTKKEIEENSISEPGEIIAEKTKLPLETKAIIYAILYIVTFIVFRIKKR